MFYMAFKYGDSVLTTL